MLSTTISFKPTRNPTSKNWIHPISDGAHPERGCSPTTTYLRNNMRQGIRNSFAFNLQLPKNQCNLNLSEKLFLILYSTLHYVNFNYNCGSHCLTNHESVIKRTTAVSTTERMIHAKRSAFYAVFSVQYYVLFIISMRILLLCKWFLNMELDEEVTYKVYWSIKISNACQIWQMKARWHFPVLVLWIFFPKI